MIQGVYSVFDTKANAFLQPFFSVTKGSAIRSFSDAVNDPNHMIAKHREDYVLFYLGTFEDLSGSFKLDPAPVSLGLATEFVRQ